jgi:polyferredoxin
MGKSIPSALVDDGAMYVSERKIYPRDVDGRFQRLRALAVFVLLGMYYVFPWLQWQGRQAVLFGLAARKFYIFGLAFWPQDFIFLALGLVLAGMTLFFFTAVAGRLWCGYACPQTVWTEVFVAIERWTEGDRGTRIKLDAAPWSWNKLRRRGTRHAAWLVLALWTGFTFVGFFTPIRELALRTFPFAWSGWETFWVLFYALATWGNAGILREQVCKYMCPYARFQSAMFDRDTLIIAYDPMRGEPRGPRKRTLKDVFTRARGLLDVATAYDYVFRATRHPSAADNRLQAAGTIMLADVNTEARPLPKFAPEELGDCIDCTICVQVCPTGIDIRNGLQYECIACGACIDACNDVMDKMGYARGLIRYTTQNAIDGGQTRVARPRIVVYTVLLVALVAAWAWGVTTRSTLIVDVLRDRNALYRSAADGRIENGYTLKLVNKAGQARGFRIEVASKTPGIALREMEQPVHAEAEEVLSLPVVLSAPASVTGRQDVVFTVRSEDGAASETVDSTFFGPL